MTGWLYLIRNRDLYKIGITKNYESRMRQLKPDNVIAKLYSRNYLKLERELHDKYKEYRIPQTEYFRLQNKHLKEIKQRLYKFDYPASLTLGLFIKSFLYTVLMFLLVFIFISLSVNEINILLLNTFLFMERICFGFSFLSLFFHSGRYLSAFNEVKYRISRLFIFILFGFSFRVVNLFLS